MTGDAQFIYTDAELKKARSKVDFSNTPNIHDYVMGNNKTFDQSGFNEIDGLVLSQVANMKFDKWGIDEDITFNSNKSMTFKELAQAFEAKHANDTDKVKAISHQDQLLLQELGRSERFGNLQVSDFVHDPASNPKNNDIAKAFNSVNVTNDNKALEQFAAVTITYEQNCKTYHYISYRATDSSAEGWEEDVMMALTSETQAQADSVIYMNYIGNKYTGENDRLLGGGHSKGGNDFEYAYLFCDESVKNRIEKGYLYDSPGMDRSVLKKTNRYEDFQKIISGTFICPQDSVIGQLIQENKNAKFIHSEGHYLLDEHDPYSWRIEVDKNGNYHFVPDKQSSFSKYVNEAIDNTLLTMSKPEKEYLFTTAMTFLEAEKILNKDKKSTLGDSKERQELFIKYLMKSLCNNISNPMVNGVMILCKLLFFFNLAAEKDMVSKKVEIRQKTAQKIDEAIKKSGKLINNGINEFTDYVKDLFNKSKNKTEEFYHDLINAKLFGIISVIMPKIKSAIYVSDNSIVKVDTELLRSYAQRLSKINQKLDAADSTLKRLYSEVKLLDILDLLHADIIVGSNNSLKKCAEYAEKTAEEFEAAEKAIIGQL